MDGCRLPNAAAAMNTSLREITADVGVDVLSFGGAKNGLPFGEAIIFFREELAEEFEYIQKQCLQLHSKMRFISTQFIPYLEQNVWHKNANHANLMCSKLWSGLSKLPKVKLAFPVETNQLFCHLPDEMIKATQAIFPYYVWDQKTNLVRMVTSFDTTPYEVEEFVKLAQSSV